MPADITFASQFIVTDKKQLVSLAWPKEQLMPSLTLFYHPGLPVVRTHSEEQELVLLGVALDIDSPRASPVELLSAQMKLALSWTELEQAIEAWSGRWALIVRLGEELRVYHDCCGLSPVFYTDGSGGAHCFASTPALMASQGLTVKDEEAAKDVFRHKHRHAWPIGFVPYTGVRHLLPNHYLDWSALTARRYWPRPEHALAGEAAASAVAELNALLAASLNAIKLRGECHMGVSGGYDSRVLFAAAESLDDSFGFYNLTGGHWKAYDEDIPRRIGRLGNAAIEVYHLNDPTLIPLSPAVESRLAENVGEMFIDPVVSVFPLFQKVAQSGVVIEGLAAEVLRNYYHSAEHLPEDREALAVFLAQRTGYESNPYAIKGIADWLQQLPEHCEPILLDLLYWEHRVGVWGALGWTMREGIFSTYAPFSNRRILARGLRVRTEDRAPPHRLFRLMIERLNPALAELPFNQGFS